MPGVCGPCNKPWASSCHQGSSTSVILFGSYPTLHTGGAVYSHFIRTKQVLKSQQCSPSSQVLPAERQNQYRNPHIVVEHPWDHLAFKNKSLWLFQSSPGKWLSLRFPAAVLLLCSPVSSWDPKEPCVTSDSWEATVGQAETYSQT